MYEVSAFFSSVVGIRKDEAPQTNNLVLYREFQPVHTPEVQVPT